MSRLKQYELGLTIQFDLSSADHSCSGTEQIARSLVSIRQILHPAVHLPFPTPNLARIRRDHRRSVSLLKPPLQ